MSGTSKKPVFCVKWKMFPHVPPTCSQMFPNTLLVVLGVLNEQCVGEHPCVPGYKTRVHVFPNNSTYPCVVGDVGNVRERGYKTRVHVYPVLHNVPNDGEQAGTRVPAFCTRVQKVFPRIAV